MRRYKGYNIWYDEDREAWGLKPYYVEKDGKIYGFFNSVADAKGYIALRVMIEKLNKKMRIRKRKCSNGL